MDEDDPETVEVARLALLPIANFRAANPRATAEAAEAPAEPVADAQPAAPPK